VLRAEWRPVREVPAEALAFDHADMLRVAILRIQSKLRYSWVAFQLLPEQFEHEITLPRTEILDVVRRVSVMAQRNLPLRLRFAEGELTISAQAQDVGEARESLPAPFTAAEPLEIGFNAEFLRDGIESVEADEIQLRLISPLRPGLIRSEEDDFQYLIMPIRLAG